LFCFVYTYCTHVQYIQVLHVQYIQYVPAVIMAYPTLSMIATNTYNDIARPKGREKRREGKGRK
jgi:hypothetical protein